MNQEIKESSANEQNVPAQPPVVAVLTPQISEENPPATAGCAAAPSSAGGIGNGIVVLPKSKWVINLNNVVSISQFYDPRYDTGMIVTTSGLFVGLPKEHFAELLEVIQ